MSRRAIVERGWPWLRHTLLVGVVGGLAMVPVGLAARALGASVNVYGELAIRTLTGGVDPLLLGLEHLLVSCAMAGPLVIVLQLARHRHAAALGLAYGAGTWLLVNSLALPFVFGTPTPWQMGVSSVWGSLLVHLVFGGVAALQSRRLAQRSGATGDAVPRETAAQQERMPEGGVR